MAHTETPELHDKELELVDAHQSVNQENTKVSFFLKLFNENTKNALNSKKV